MTMPIYIYALVDPRNEQVRYIGRTKYREKRYNSHITGARNGSEKTYKANWIRLLLKRSLLPIMQTIEAIEDEAVSAEREKFWITKYKQRGATLTNLTVGGDGTYGYKFTKEQSLKQSISKLMKSRKDPEFLQSLARRYHEIVERERELADKKSLELADIDAAEENKRRMLAISMDKKAKAAENKAMKKTLVKKPRKLEPKKAAKTKASKPTKTGLSKSDPDYYAKIGAISAAKRKLPTSFFSEMAKKSHLNRSEYKGGRKKKVQELESLSNEMDAATEQ